MNKLSAKQNTETTNAAGESPISEFAKFEESNRMYGKVLQEFNEEWAEIQSDPNKNAEWKERCIVFLRVTAKKIYQAGNEDLKGIDIASLNISKKTYDLLKGLEIRNVYEILEFSVAELRYHLGYRHTKSLCVVLSADENKPLEKKSK